MFPQNLFLRQALGPRGINILATDFFKEHVFRQYGHYRQVACYRSGNRQGHMPQIIFDFTGPRERIEIIADQTALREPGKKAAAAKQHQQHQAQDKRRYSIADQNDHTRNRIESAAIPDRLGNTQRNTYQISQEERPQTQTHRYRHFLFHQFKHSLVMEKALAQIETGEFPYHIGKTRYRRLVETV